MSSVDASSVTLINVFEVTRERTDAFVDPWRERAALLVTKPGFLGGRLYRALGPQIRFQFVNVAHWATSDAWRGATADPRSKSRSLR
jgi:heme oxygenase (mycobilin-producing)